jgi:nucleotide-binding universal stress UspA family protein
MYHSIYVPVDNSRHSNRAIDTAVALGESFGSELVGCHVYAAKMHDYRFKQMEFTLPEEYLVEQELHRQRKIHDSLITMGLQLISDCYLEPMEKICQERGLALTRKMMDGKHSTELVRDIEESDYDLVVLGVLGIGRTRDSQIGSVCARVTQQCDKDVWVVKHLPRAEEPERDTILVGVDGSPRSFGALMTGVELARRFGKKLEVVGVYDPYLHYAVFKGIVDVLTEKAAKVFRFEEQNQLHEEIIDTGLAQIYQSHVNVAAAMAKDEGIEATRTLLDGKAFQKLLDHARKVEPWVMIVGRTGVHSAEGEEGLGSNTENLLRLAPCDVLITAREVVPELDLKAEESIHWTPEALARMERVPPQVLGIARTAILRLAIEQGHSVVSSDLVTEAMERFMPKRTAEANVKLAEALVLDRATPVAVCKSCGVAARSSDAVRCTVCGGEELETLSHEEIARIIEAEGGVEEETTYDGRKIRWTQEARQALKRLPDAYQRRRAKARIEKSARIHKLDPIGAEFAQRFIDEEAGVLYREAAGNGAEKGAGNGNGTGHGHGEEEPPRHVDSGAGNADGELASATAAAADDEPERCIRARDAAGNPLISAREWTPEAVERVLRVPAGFMRDKTQGRIEELATERSLATVDLPLVEEGIAIGRQMMAEMLGAQTGASEETAQQAVEKAACPAEAEADAEASAVCPAHQVTSEVTSAEDPNTDRDAAAETGREEDREVVRSLPLNEVSVVAAMEKRRRQLGGDN